MKVLDNNNPRREAVNAQDFAQDFEEPNVMQEGPEEDGPTDPSEEKVELLLTEVNNFMSIVDAVLIEDVRASVIIRHFTKMLLKSNPHLNQNQS
jgi:hypothetical protein